MRSSDWSRALHFLHLALEKVPDYDPSVRNVVEIYRTTKNWTALADFYMSFASARSDEVVLVGYTNLADGLGSHNHHIKSYLNRSVSF